MRRYTKIIILFVVGALFAACTNDDMPTKETSNRNIGIKLLVQDFKGTNVRSGFMSNESQITNLFVALFANGNSYKYYITEGSVSGPNGGSWDKDNGEILLGLTQDDVGNSCDVFVIANIDETTKSALTNAANADALKATYVSNNTPWSTEFGTTLIMSGFETGHDFVDKPVLNKIEMSRTVAKLEVNITLTGQYQNTSEGDYKYRLVNFDKKTYLIKPGTKTNDLVSQPVLQPISGIMEFVRNGATITGLKLTTYINERDNVDVDGGEGNSKIELQLPFWDNGAPPPQFLDDVYSIVLNEKIERNHYYTVEVKM